MLQHLQICRAIKRRHMYLSRSRSILSTASWHRVAAHVIAFCGRANDNFHSALHLLRHVQQHVQQTTTMWKYADHTYLWAM
jgi:hypothetical protein